MESKPAEALIRMTVALKCVQVANAHHKDASYDRVYWRKLCVYEKRSSSIPPLVLSRLSNHICPASNKKVLSIDAPAHDAAFHSETRLN